MQKLKENMLTNVKKYKVTVKSKLEDKKFGNLIFG